MKSKVSLLLIFIITPFLWAQGSGDGTPQENLIPLNRVVILTSGLTYYEHSGFVDGSVSLILPFKFNAVNDALKTLIVNDPSSPNPSVSYQSENTLFQTLRSLKVDLSDMPDLANILLRLRGVEVEVTSASVYRGRITGIEHRMAANTGFSVMTEPWLLLNTGGRLMSINLNDISSIRFLDPAIEHDLNRALDLIAASTNNNSRHLIVNLPAGAGNVRRRVSLSYVVPSPVWKVSYRLDLGATAPLFQGWAIVDNDSDTDWNNVELSLVTGRPSSFIQELYPPYYVSRPVVPLSIAGTAAAVTHERAVTTAQAEMRAPAPAMARSEAFLMDESAPAFRDMTNLAGGNIQTAQGTDAGGQFEFTIRNPVSLDRQMSAMFPLVESRIQANKVLIYNGRGRHPRLGAEIVNTSGMKLPAGPITVYDGGVYAGDALIEFWNENEKRLISFGEDLAVTASSNDTNTRAVSTVRISGGVMTINRHLTFVRTYSFINSGVSKQLVVEHTRTTQSELVSPQANEQTPALYRFNVTLAANSETTLAVSEQRPLSESITLLPLRLDALLSYSTNQEIPANVRRALERAVELRRAVDTADAEIRDIEAQRNRLVADQDRIRRNLEAAGNQTSQGQEYLRRLVALDSEIDGLSTRLERANANARTARTAFENYLNSLNL